MVICGHVIKPGTETVPATLCKNQAEFGLSVYGNPETYMEVCRDHLCDSIGFGSAYAVARIEFINMLPVPEKQ